MKNLLHLISLSSLDPRVQKFVDSYQLVPSFYIDHLGKTIFLENNLASKDKFVGINLTTDSNVDSVYIEGQNEEQNIELPLGLELGDSIVMVSEKLKTDPFLKYTNASDDITRKFILTYIHKNLSLIIGFDKHQKMITFSCSELADYLKDHFAWKDCLIKQQLYSSIDVTDLKEQSPLGTWRERLEENENYRKTNDPEFIEHYWYTSTRLDRFENIIESYLAALNKQCNENSALGIEIVVKDYLIKINNFNKEINMIETDEREELCPFFDTTIKATGIKLPEGFDPTLVYRDW